MTIVYILAALVIFGFLIGIHEFGHFIVAKAFKVQVNEFSIGMGPAIFHKQKGETQYSLRILPIGGYCAMEGEDEDSESARALNNQPFYKKFFVYIAGATMNFLTGFLIIVILYSGAAAFYTPVITGFADGCPLESADGLQTGDRILSIDGERIYIYSDISLLTSLNKDGTFDLVVERDGEKVKLTDFAMEKAEYTSSDGSTYTGYGIFFGAEETNFLGRIRYSWNNTIDFVRTVRLSLKMLITGQAGLKDMSGPVGIVSTITEVGQQSENFRDAIENILYFGALIAVNLAVMNMLPLPALDGGKVLFLIVNAIAMFLFRKTIPSKYENYVHYAGMILLLALMAVITFHDVWKLFT